ncbi:MAG: cytochrome b N-terminal domain-containing protein [Nitrospinota bacterium]|nr:cytochrome b N-terminal domain-containing protein [Nitrospinota bacterium]MDH5678015.1 cytochrome b N-terminal domain-containing protein [Nitrospinota bacterium]MDH5755726.1 cytochrome b N-terminal domain-containing protein [Nitrospinota bacterium]
MDIETLHLGPIKIKNKIAIRLFSALDDRLGVKEILDDEVFEKIVPAHLGFWSCFGGISFFLFISQVLTGMLLMVYYEPTIEEAHGTVAMIMNEVPFGWLIRGAHAWGSNLMLVTIMIHMVKIYVSGIYKPPRELNWVVGVTLFLLTLGLSFTGYLLPWTQLAYWATVVGTETPAALPYVGEYIRYAMRGGEEIGQVTLTRFFAIHVMLLPVITASVIGLHLIQIRRQGIAGPM